MNALTANPTNEPNQLTKRQQAILNIIAKSPTPIPTANLEKSIATTYDISRDTLSRDLSTLIKSGLIAIVGSGPATAYFIHSTILAPLDLDAYFALPQDERSLIAEPNSEFLDKISSLDLLPSIATINKSLTTYRKKLSDLPTTLHAKELERFVIDFAWKSSAIEGNTYSQLDTEALLKYRQKASGHSEQEAIMIINHKATFDLVRNNLSIYKKLNLSDILDIHKSLVQGLDIDLGIRRHTVKITGTNYIPPDNRFTIEEHLGRAIDIINAKSHPIEKSFVASALIMYLQPFADGNKRTARMLGNAILMANNITPISYRNTDDATYKKAVLIIDEQHNLLPYRDLYLSALDFSATTYLA